MPSESVNQQFSGKLPAFMVMPFAYAIPFAEVTAGALILLGLFISSGFGYLWSPVDWADFPCGHVGAGTHGRT